MPVTGRKPKPPGQAVNRNKPAHEWSEIVDTPFRRAPKLPARRPNGYAWPSATKRWYAAVSSMPHCSLWSASDWLFVEHTARLVAAFDEGDYRQATEIRQREKKLGVTADDRRDLRIRYVEAKPEPIAEVTSLDDYRDL